MELNITHLQHYLAYGLKVQYEGIINGTELKQWEKEFSDRYEINGIYPTIPCPEAIIGDKIGFVKRIEFRKNGSPSFLIGNKVGKRYYDLEGVKPLLLPLSVLYEEIDGEIGIIELAKIATSDLQYCNDLHWVVGGKKDKYATARKEEYDFAFDYDGVGAFWLSQRDVYDGSCPEIEIHSQLALFDYLFSHHYDVYGLTDKGLAIDKRTV